MRRKGKDIRRNVWYGINSILLCLMVLNNSAIFSMQLSPSSLVETQQGSQNLLNLFAGLKDPATRADAVGILVSMVEEQGLGGDSEIAIGKFLYLLGDENWYIRKPAAELLEKIDERQGLGTHTEAVIEKMVPLLEDIYGEVRGSVSSALSNIVLRKSAQYSERVIKKCLVFLDGANTAICGSAISVLSRIATEQGLGVYREAVIKKVVPLLTDKNADIRSDSASLLGSIAKKQGLGERAAEEVLQQLIRLLNDGYKDVRSAALVTLGKIYTTQGLGSYLRAVVGRMVLLLGDDYWYICKNAVSMLETIAGNTMYTEVVIEALLHFVGSQDEVVCNYIERILEKIMAHRALGSYGNVIDNLLPLLGHWNLRTRKHATEIFAKLAKQEDREILVSWGEKSHDIIASRTVFRFVAENLLQNAV